MKRTQKTHPGIFGLIFLVTLVLCVPAGTYAQDAAAPLKVELKKPEGKLLFKSDDGDFQWWFDSRIQIDGAWYFENKNTMSNGATLRRLTFALKTVLFRDWRAELDVDLGEAVSTKSQVELRDMWIRYTVPDCNLAFQVGYFKEPLGMERLNSSRLLTFLERSSVSNAIPLGRRLGFSTRYWNELGQVTAAVMGHEAGTRIDKGQRDEGFSTNLRLSVAPINDHGSNLHLGVAGSYKIPDAVADLKPNTIEVSARTETYVFNPKFLHSGDITDVNYFDRFGGEFMLIQGPFYVQAEYLATNIKRWYGKSDVNFWGGYATASWMITGETRDYYINEGEVGLIDPPKNSWGTGRSLQHA